MFKKVLEISNTNYVHLFLGNLVVKQNGEKTILPINSIDTVIIENTNLILSIALVNSLIQNNINVIICDYKHLPNSQIVPFNGYYNMKIFQEQALWNNKFKNSVWTNIIKLKIKNSMLLHKYLNTLTIGDEESFITFYKEVRECDFSNREGHAAKLNFKLLFGSKFNREDEDNEINKYLNFGYAILLSYVSRSLSAKGYDLRLGVFHKSFNNYYSLACDVMEVFRCVIDYLVYTYFKNQLILNFQEFKESVFRIFYENFKIGNMKMTLIDYIEKFIGKCLKNEDVEDLYIDWSAK